MTKVVPNAYPTDLTSAFALDLYRPTGTLSIAVTQLGSPAVGATVTVTGGPNSITVWAPRIRAASPPSSTCHPARATPTPPTSEGNSGTQTGAVAPRTTTNATIVINVPMGSIKAVVTKGGAPISGADCHPHRRPVLLERVGRHRRRRQLHRLGAGGTGYTVTATSGTSASQERRGVTSGNTTTVNLDITVPMGTIKTIVKINGVVVPGASVTITGGPYPMTRPRPPPTAPAHRCSRSRQAFDVHGHRALLRPDGRDDGVTVTTARPTPSLSRCRSVH